ncbi:lytic transglycosylase domain-containing protein [Cytobacillus sp. FJAT-54145]|uniref:Lytic transglycosylase domain-containing protein n=1 Tax=Cytobacillus spartinae TaxID=3299023 RepID=A0ABW6KCF9_9BACI
MNIENLKVMLQLQALQNFNSSTSNVSSSGSLFQELMDELLLEQGTSPVTEPSKVINTGPLTNLASLPPVKLTKLANNHSSNFDDIIQDAAKTYQLPVNLIYSVIKQESNFNPNAVSHAGASGLMQLMPATAQSLGVNNVFDPRENIFGGSKYLRQMLDKYDNNIELALAAYNAGPGNVEKHGGIPPFKETQNYVKKVTNSMFV